jgi:hopene-associated glycosyltransferase HpnB
VSIPALSLLVLEAAALGAWLFVLLGRARAWQLEPRADEGEALSRDTWPAVHVLVPARNEQGVLPATLPALLEQDYPGPWRVILVDDRSSDGTALLASSFAPGDGRLRVVSGEPLPAGWIGKVWALEQAARESARDQHQPAYLLLTDADIRHACGSVRRLVAESELAGLALNSRMARLRCASPSERLLIPPFLFFFNLLFPMRQVNDPASRRAAAAGGCVLLRRSALEAAGGFAAISGEVIDDVSLADRIKALPSPIRLSLSRSEIVSIREYGSVSAVWRMVRRTAFDQLDYSWLLLAATLAALGVLFVAPVAGLAIGAAVASGTGDEVWWAVAGLGLGAWCAATLAYLPAIAYFGLRRAWSLTRPLAGILYGGMTIDSAARSRRGVERW